MTSWWLASVMPGNSATSQCSCKLRGKGASGCRGGASRRLRPPELLEPLGASAIPFVEFGPWRKCVTVIEKPSFSHSSKRHVLSRSCTGAHAGVHSMYGKREETCHG